VILLKNRAKQGVLPDSDQHGHNIKPESRNENRSLRSKLNASRAGRHMNVPGEATETSNAELRPRVLLVMIRPEGSPARPTGGGQVTAIQIALHLHELGVKMYVLERSPSILFGPSVLKAYVLSNKSGFLRDTVALIKMARNTKCDSLFAFTEYFEETIVPSFLAAFVTRKKLFVNVTSEAHRAEDTQSFIGLIRDRVRRKPGFRTVMKYAGFQVARRLACRMGTCLVATRFMKSYADSLLNARRTFVVGRGVEEFWFSSSDVDGTYDCVYSGRFDHSKRISTLIKAWQIVAARKQDAKLLLLGDSGTELQLVRRMVTDLGLSSNVTFSGFISDRRILADKIRSARVFVFPSVSEGFGLAVAEAMAAGLPCVLSDIAPLREVYGDSAVFANPDDPSAFADAILDLLLDERKRLDYSERSRLSAKSFSWVEVSRKVLRALTKP
jgi:glycosyltransferase involved in cell wall biosynthesis